jgi:mono/diheme cytochrome c family protein
MSLHFPILLALAAPASDLEAKVKAIFEDANCTACHGDEHPSLEGSLARLTSVKSKATGKPIVAAGNPDGSYLMAKLTGKGMVGDQMPQGGDPLSAAQRKTVSDWIASLAPADKPSTPTPTPTPAPSAGGGGGGDVAAANKKVADAEAKVQKIVADQCASCHDSGSDEVVLTGGLERLTKERSKATGKPFIVAGDPDNSYLLTKMTGGKGMQGDLMPLGGDKLPKGDLDAVREYINALSERDQASAAAAGGSDTTSPSDTVAPDPIEPTTGGEEDPPADEPKKTKPPFHGTFQINLPTTTTLGRRSFEFRIDHRFGRVGEERGAFGLDAGANISYAFAYGILDGWDVMLRRTNSRKGYELATKYIFLRQEAGKKLSLGAYASVEYFRDFPSNTANPWSGNFQLLLSRLWFERWSTMLTIGYHLRTDHKATPQVDLADDGVDGPVAVRDKRGTLGVGLASTVWLGQQKKWGIDMEYHLPIPVNVFYYNGGNADPGGSNIGSWSIGGSVRTGLHFFQIFITNTREIHTSLYAPGGQSKNPFENRGNFFFGFNLSRKWSL